VLGYLLKPIRMDELETVLSRVTELIRDEETPLARSVTTGGEKAVASGGPAAPALEDHAPLLSDVSAEERIEAGGEISLNILLASANSSFPVTARAARFACMVVFAYPLAVISPKPASFHARPSLRRAVSRMEKLCRDTMPVVPLRSRGAVLIFLSAERDGERVVRLASRACEDEPDIAVVTWTGGLVSIEGETVSSRLLERLDRVVETRRWHGFGRLYTDDDRRSVGGPSAVDISSVMGQVPRHASVGGGGTFGSPLRVLRCPFRPCRRASR